MAPSNGSTIATKQATAAVSLKELPAALYSLSLSCLKNVSTPRVDTSSQLDCQLTGSDR